MLLTLAVISCNISCNSGTHFDFWFLISDLFHGNADAAERRRLRRQKLMGEKMRKNQVLATEKSTFWPAGADWGAGIDMRVDPASRDGLHCGGRSPGSFSWRFSFCLRKSGDVRSSGVVYFRG